MSHMTIKHLEKDNSELIYRMLVEWKSSVGCFYYDITNEINKSICIDKFHSGNEIVCIYKFKKAVGHGFNRMFQEIETNYARIVYDLNNEIITGYPELSMGYLTGYTYEIDTISLFSLSNNKHLKSELWKFYLSLKEKLNYEIRFILNKKNPQIRIYLNDYVVKINKNYNIKVFNSDNLYNDFYCNNDNIYSYISELAYN